MLVLVPVGLRTRTGHIYHLSPAAASQVLDQGIAQTVRVTVGRKGSPTLARKQPHWQLRQDGLRLREEVKVLSHRFLRYAHRMLTRLLSGRRGRIRQSAVLPLFV